jgi:CheY-like chemotaxis protein
MGALMNRILIVDDDFDICEALQLVLEPRYEVEVAHNGRQALERMAETTFDAVVLDLMMPVMDGEALMQALRERGDHTPIVFASAATHLAARARAAGAAAWLAKPFEARQLEAALERALGSGGGPTGGSGDAGPSGKRRAGSVEVQLGAKSYSFLAGIRARPISLA